MNRYRIYCGPLTTAYAANQMEKNGIDVYFISAEHIYVDTDRSVDELIKVLEGTWKECDFQLLNNW
jgi:hypothetical protein